IAVRNGLPQACCVLIGAAALGCHLEMTWRKTADLDLTILADLAAILEDYLRADDPRRWESPLLELALEFEVQSAWALGRDVCDMATVKHLEVIERFIAVVCDEDRPAFAAFSRHFSPPNREESLRRKLEAFALGLRWNAPQLTSP
ncbi:MAG: hypothetical protein AB7K71_41085, partial [Polyangiaceae bacterium]